jgi:ubiquinone/menaquinone biosynthesis C-methylase UbiE
MVRTTQEAITSAGFRLRPTLGKSDHYHCQINRKGNEHHHTRSYQYNRALWLLERLSLRSLRQMLLEQAQGNILEVGIGTGVNLPLYNGARLITGIDLNVGRLAGTRIRESNCPFLPGCADAHHLPFAPRTFDTVISTLVFCCVAAPGQALAEIRRVLKPGGQFLLLEHVRGQGPVSRRLTDLLHPLWFALQGECHLNRETAKTVSAAGFQITEIGTHGWGLLQTIHAAAD